MKKLTLLSLFLLFSTAFASAGKVIIIDLTFYNNNTAILNGISVGLGVPTVSETGPYSLSVLSGESVLSSVSFNLSFIESISSIPPDLPVNESLMDENLSSVKPDEYNTTIEPSELIELNESQLILIMSYSAIASGFSLSFNDSLLFEQSFSLCNNDGVCDSGENYFSCLNDCPSGSSDGLCDELFDSVCDPDCVSQGRSDRDPDCTCGNSVCDPRENSINCPIDCGAPVNELQNLVFLIIGGGVAIIVGIIALIVWLVRRRRKKKKPKTKPKRAKPAPKRKKKSAKRKK